jgi:hypothetical protein
MMAEHAHLGCTVLWALPHAEMIAVSPLKLMSGLATRGQLEYDLYGQTRNPCKIDKKPIKAS